MTKVAEIDPFWAWGDDTDQPRVLHTMLRVRDVDQSLCFYRDGLGMTLLDRYDVEQGRFSILFLSFAGYRDGPAAVELTYNWDADIDYTHGSGFGHIAIGVPDVTKMYTRLADYGGTQITAPKTLFAGGPQLAFVKDPDGYPIELIQIRRGTDSN
ncbi:Lactoylglutathione lyase [Sphingobium herbicidovorans NBRC 16415]|uniref:Aldoketomutase n=1 Tax=Sphingobium herbicidovorans (strain ATCC 700291 / DSM 11019 / CCUG 56400 / KCTC 2939 / LMG 18315 / NBRC 16415 / MH) TaxID=1219045 RepID=A0A086PC18_SPHHM|nr:VOC family protein [Sphingobium herbicidovorans]KFG90936.1 Lactoylglutathione lyase [Sphingobium herbicidovorans NBRC 16415]